MNPPHEHVIQTRGLSKSFNDVHALRPLDLTVEKNSIVGFLGPNGAGKTTAIKLLLGLIRPTRGEGKIFGHDIVRESIKVRKRVGYLPQDPRFFEYMTPRKTLEFTARFFFRGPVAAIDQRVEETLALVGLSDKADRPIKGFSGGERQRLGIAQAQVHYPDLILLDEPAAALDPLGRRDVLEVMSRLREHATIFFSTHILDDVQRVSDSVAILNRGELVAQGSIDELVAGSSGVAYLVTVKGEAAGAQARISNQPWVKDVQTKGEGDGATLLVSVSDSEAAESQLLRLLLADEQLVVSDFRREEHNLEEVFIGIIEGEEDGR
jgi:ABC-2 type transport system ATP-binding protein